MRIESSNINMSSTFSSIESHTKDESLKMWTGNQRPNFETQDNVPGPNLSDTDYILNLSDESKELLEKMKAQTNAVEDDQNVLFKLSDADKQKIQLIQEVIERLTGKRLKFSLPKEIKLDRNSADFFIRGKNIIKAEPIRQPVRQGWGLEYDFHETHYEKEQMSFESSGKIKTADGREIDFSLQLNMSREFMSRQDIRIRAGDAKIDPLVINFDSPGPMLTDTKYSFDLDSDGKSDQISFVAPGSGFLALDLNSDGAINNGKELFGPNTGSGFSELAQYDSDGNNWIDENDSIYDKLRIWTKDAEGNDRLFALGQKGIGAIYLGNVDTQFSMKDSENNLQGEVRKTGIFVRENGSVGTINHVDLAV